MSGGVLLSIAQLISDGILFIGDGYRAKNEELADHGLPFARGANINNGFLFDDVERVPSEKLQRIGNKVSKPGDVVFTSKGTVGRFAYVTEDIERFVYSPQLCFWRTLNPNVIDSRFLFYWMQGPEFFDQYSSVKGQTDMADYVSLTDQRRMKITLPPLPEQRAIARILGALDDKIEANRRANATLEATARALFQSWFVDFDPVRAKAEGRQPDGMDAETAALFPDSFEDSALGAVPAGWVVQPLSEHISAVKGLSYKGDGLADFGDGMPMHNLNSVYEGGGYKYDGIKHYTGEYQERHIATAGDLIVTNTEQGHDMLLIGYPALIPNNYPAGLFSHHLYRVTPLDGSHITSRFIYFLMRTDVFHEVIGGYTNGTTVNMLPVDGLQRPLFVVPSQELVTQFDRVAASILAKMEAAHEESEQLTQTRDALLPKLISGEVRVGDWEREFGGGEP